MDSTTRELAHKSHEAPDDAAAYERLKAHHLALGEVHAAMELMERWGGSCPRPLEASQAYVDAAQLALEDHDHAGRVVSLLERALVRYPYHARAVELLRRHFASRADADGWLASLERRHASLAQSGGFTDALADLAEAIEHARSGRGETSAPYIEDVSEIVEVVSERVEDVTEIVEDAGERVEDASEIVEDVGGIAEDARGPLPESGEIIEDVTEIVEDVSAESVGIDDVEEVLELAEPREPATRSSRHAAR